MSRSTYLKLPPLLLEVKVGTEVLAEEQEPELLQVLVRELGPELELELADSKAPLTWISFDRALTSSTYDSSFSSSLPCSSPFSNKLLRATHSSLS